LKQFHYDYFNRLLSQTIFTTKNGEWSFFSQETYLYDGQNELGAYPQELRILGQGKGAEIGAAIAIEKQGKIYAPMHDLFGNVVALLDPSSGKALETYRYSAFGEERVFAASIGNPWRFQSKRKIGDLVCFGRRFYHPETGRWISPDPKGFEEGPHLYQFNRNNPFVHVDLYGEELASLWSPIAGPGDCFSNPILEQEEKERNWDLVLSVLDKSWNNPHFQGSLEAFGGAAETTVGNLLTTVSLVSGNPGGLVLGVSVATHGLDRFFTGMNNAITGGYQESVTAQSLQAAGVSKEKAHIVDDVLSFGGIVYGTGLIRNASRLINPPFLLPETPFSRPSSFAGKESPLPVQMHHFATNKHKAYTREMKTIANRFGLSLEGSWNKKMMPHLGRHPNDYHEFVLFNMREAAKEAQGDPKVFLRLFEEYVKEPVINNPDLLNKSGW
jgi:RHS repeat-associated protein